MKVNSHKRQASEVLRTFVFSAAIVLSPLSASVGFAQDDEDPPEASVEASSEATPETPPEQPAEEETQQTEKPNPDKAPKSVQDKSNAPRSGEDSADAAPAKETAEPAKPAVPTKPWQLSTEPLFKGPTVKRFQFPSDLTARDRQLLENLDYKPSGTKLRLEQIKKLIAELKKSAPKSDASVTASLSMLRLYEEQALVFEWMRVVGVADPKYPDIAQTLKNIRRQQAQRYYDLILNHPKHPNLKQWKFNQVIARLRLGDPSVRDEALGMLKTATGTEARELAAVGVAMDASTGRLPSPFGTLESIAQNSTDQYESAAFKIMIAEQNIITNKTQLAIATLQDVIATCKGIRRGDKEQTPGTILQAAAYMLINAGLKSSVTVNQEIIQTLTNNDLMEYARSYLEQYALANYSKNLSAALKAYGDALAIGTVAEELKSKAEVRMLDLNIASNDPRMLQLAWERVISRGIQKQLPLESQLLHSMNIIATKFKMRPDKESATQMVALHDSFARGFAFYAAREDYSLRVLDALFQTKQFSDAIKRSEIAIVRFKDKMNRVSAYNFNLKSRAQLMGFGSELKISSGVKLTGDQSLATGYVSNADKLRAMLPPHEGEQFHYMTAFVQLLAGPQKVALARYEYAFSKFPRNPNSSDSASVLLDILTQRKELVEVEKFARLFTKIAIIPSRDPYKDLPRLIERTAFDIAKQQFDAKQYEVAATRFVNFQKEFPASPQAPAALERAGLGYSQANKAELSLAAYDLFLKLYPKLSSAKEIRWTAAEMSESRKQHLKAAEHFQAYGLLYPAEGVQKFAAFKAAENFRLANRIPESLSEYERYLKGAKAPAEQIRILRLMSDVALKNNNSMIALSTLERLSKIVKQADDVIGVQFNLMNVYQKMSRDDASKKSAALILSLKPTTAEGFKMQSKAKFIIGRFDVNALRTRQVMNQKDLKDALQSLFKEYEKVKTELLAPCEIPGVDWCALGYFEVSKLAADLSKMLAVVEPSNYLDEALVSEIKSLVAWNKDKLKSESRSFALQAEDALSSSGIPDAESAEKIKMYAQQMKMSRSEDDAGGAGGAGVGGEGDF